jgi:hypothetical protein
MRTYECQLLMILLMRLTACLTRHTHQLNRFTKYRDENQAIAAS